RPGNQADSRNEGVVEDVWSLKQAQKSPTAMATKPRTVRVCNKQRQKSSRIPSFSLRSACPSLWLDSSRTHCRRGGRSTPLQPEPHTFTVSRIALSHTAQHGKNL